MMEHHIATYLQRWNEAHKEPLTDEELEDLETEDLISEMPGGERLEPEEAREGKGVHALVDDPYNYGMTIHRGALSEDEWENVDLQVVREHLASWLGTTPEDIKSIYGPGGKTYRELELRAEVDEKLLQAVEGGASKVALARALGWGLKKPHNQSPVLQKALKRARKSRAQ